MNTLIIAVPGTNEYRENEVPLGTPCGLLKRITDLVTGEQVGPIPEISGSKISLVFLPYSGSFGPVGGEPTNLSYHDSVDQGRDLLLTELDKAVHPSSTYDNIIILGYSQGAEVVYEGLNRAMAVNHPALNLIKAVHQFGNPTRAKGSSYPLSSQTEPGQGISGKSFLGFGHPLAGLSSAFIGIRQGWREYVIPGDIYASSDVEKSYVDEVYHSACEFAFASPQDMVDLCMSLISEGGIAQAWVNDAIKRDGLLILPRIAQTALTFGTFFYGEVDGTFKHTRYHIDPIFNGLTAVESSARAINALLDDLYVNQAG